MNTLCWPDWLDEVWAKSAGRGANSRPESLAMHTWQVLRRLSEFIHLRPHLPDRLGVPRLWHLLSWAAFLHDWGKAAAGFQAQLRGQGRWEHRHEVLSLAFVDWVAAGLTDEEQDWVTAAIVAHHKDADEIRRLYPPPDDPDDDQVADMVGELDEGVLDGLYRWLDKCAISWLKELGLERLGVEAPSLPPHKQAIRQVQEQGVASIYRRLKRYRRFVRRLEHDAERRVIIGTLALRGYLVNADHSASAHAGPLPRATFEARDILHSRGLQFENLFAHQLRAGQVVGSALLTAPTGSGKTEAALLWAARQAQTGDGLPRLFYTLPYQASMNAMKLRLEQSFPNQVGLQHGRSLLALYRMLMEGDYAPQEAARRAKWARNLVQLNYPPVRVLSPYQILKGMYRLKGYEAMLSDCHDAAFVLDEIHAYEVKRLALILKTVEYLRKNYAARFLVMSATFPSLIKGWLRDALDAPVEVTASVNLFKAFQRHRLVLLDGELYSEEGLNRIVNDAQAGKSVLVICNLVDRARAVYHALKERLAKIGIPVILLHGRFNGRDRLHKEQVVRKSVGASGARANLAPAGDGDAEATSVAVPGSDSIVLVSTQVVEVSLDIDLDTLYTDPAPLEALVQRFGRVNRRGQQTGLAPVHVYRLPDDGQHIYNRHLIAGALRVLKRESGHPLDESAVGMWLDEIYSGEIAHRWQEAYFTAAQEFEETCLHSLHAFDADEGLAELFYRAFDGLEVLPASLYDEYEMLKEEDPIRAAELLVPISWGRYYALANEGRVLPREPGEPYIVQATYDSETGLAFTERENDDEI
ncbi:CRISPR-associated helicase Cas3' [Candidatus Parcubacteria bacterium]|nr:MAG: CRISPR-associated helicase Cas3' [Candidatus Parcubacteria bacterium]